VATTNPGGAGKWKSEYNEHFYGKRVIVIPDNDAPGREHAEQIANHLVEIASRVEILDLPEAVKDISDFAEMHGERFAEKFRELLGSALEFVPSSNYDAPRAEDDLHKQ